MLVPEYACSDCLPGLSNHSYHKRDWWCGTGMVGEEEGLLRSDVMFALVPCTATHSISLVFGAFGRIDSLLPCFVIITFAHAHLHGGCCDNQAVHVIISSSLQCPVMCPLMHTREGMAVLHLFHSYVVICMTFGRCKWLRPTLTHTQAAGEREVAFTRS